MKNLTPLMIFYLICAIAGFFVPWYYNWQYMQTGEHFSFLVWFQSGMVSPLSSSITTDFLIGATAAFVWMIVEGRRLKMKYLWFYIIFTFVVAWAFTCPLFLFNRERALRKQPRPI
jgi:hypothetical protein